MIGVIIGMVLVVFFFGPKVSQCSYLPNSRTLEEAKIYPLIFSENVSEFIQAENIDSAFVHNELFNKSTIINFGTDEVRETPCRTYRAEYRGKNAYDFVFQICDKKETRLTEIKTADTP